MLNVCSKNKNKVSDNSEVADFLKYTSDWKSRRETRETAPHNAESYNIHLSMRELQ